MEITTEDFDILMSALDVWAESAGGDALLGHLVYANLKHPDNMDAAKAQFEDYMTKHKEEKLTRKEQAIILKAKLVYFKRHISMQKLFVPTENENR